MNANREHSFDWELAVIVGLEKAVLLKNISYWCEENRRRAIADYHHFGEWWTSESLRSLAKKYPYFTKPSISRWMNQLCAAGWVKMFGQTGSTNFYGPGEVFNAWNSGADWKVLIDRRLSEVSQNETLGGVSQNETVVSQNETVGVSKWDTGCLKMRHTNSNVEKKMLRDVEGARAQKPTAPTSRQNRDTKSPPVPPPPPRAVTLYADSKWPSATHGDWLLDFLPRCDDLPGVDAAYYRKRVEEWSEQSGKGSANWPSKAATFAHDDHAKQQLRTLQQFGHDSISHPNSSRPTSSKSRFDLTLSSPTELQAAASELLARRSRRNEYRSDGN